MSSIAQHIWTTYPTHEYWIPSLSLFANYAKIKIHSLAKTNCDGKADPSSDIRVLRGFPCSTCFAAHQTLRRGRDYRRGDSLSLGSRNHGCVCDRCSHDGPCDRDPRFCDDCGHGYDCPAVSGSNQMISLVGKTSFRHKEAERTGPATSWRKRHRCRCICAWTFLHIWKERQRPPMLAPSTDFVTRLPFLNDTQWMPLQFETLTKVVVIFKQIQNAQKVIQEKIHTHMVLIVPWQMLIKVVPDVIPAKLISVTYYLIIWLGY